MYLLQERERSAAITGQQKGQKEEAILTGAVNIIVGVSVIIKRALDK